MFDIIHKNDICIAIFLSHMANSLQNVGDLKQRSLKVEKKFACLRLECYEVFLFFCTFVKRYIIVIVLL